MATQRPVSRRLRDAVEPVAANVYFATEAHDAYKELGLSFLPGYFCSRGGCMGEVPGHVVSAAFAVFNPDLVEPSVTEGWSKTDRKAVLEARERGATASLERILGKSPDGAARATELLRRAGEAAPLEGRAIFAGLRSLGWPGTLMGDLWRAADLLREHRGDSHNAAWVSHQIGPVEISILTELWWGMGLGSYTPTRGWSNDQIGAAAEKMRDKGLLAGDSLTEEGRELRESVEVATDRGEDAVVDALGGAAEELIDLLRPWARAIVDAGGYPADPSSLGDPPKRSAR